MNPLPIVQALHKAAGSPEPKVAIGHLFGLGEPETKALLDGKIPWWTIALLSGAIGLYFGVKAQQQYPNKIPKFFR